MLSQSNNPTTFIQGLEEITQSLEDGKTPQWFNQLRRQGLSQFTELGIPTVKDEEWKYTNLAALAKHTFKVAEEQKPDKPDLWKDYCHDGDINIVLVNGVFSKELSALGRIPQGVTVSTLKEAVSNNEPETRELLEKYDINDKTAFVALNEAFNSNGTYIRIGKNCVSPDLIHIVHLTSPGHKKTAAMPRTLIALEQSGEATVLESYVASNDKATYFSNALTDIFLDENATLHYCKSQKESLKAFHIGRTRVWQECNSSFDGFSFMAGAALTRNDLNVVLDGEGASTVINALYSLSHDQHVDNHTSVDHRVPNCTSSQLYKGILNDASRAVFNGKVFVRSVAQQTNSYQLNKNLLLGKNCRVDTKPQLEIFADDVKCTHGATIGQLDEDELFYLQTRGIFKATAAKILAHGFVDDVLNMIKNDAIHQKLNILMKPSFEAL